MCLRHAQSAQKCSALGACTDDESVAEEALADVAPELLDLLLRDPAVLVALEENVLRDLLLELGTCSVEQSVNQGKHSPRADRPK